MLFWAYHLGRIQVGRVQLLEACEMKLPQCYLANFLLTHLIHESARQDHLWIQWQGNGHEHQLLSNIENAYLASELLKSIQINK
jgi:hypothetical protein